MKHEIRMLSASHRDLSVHMSAAFVFHSAVRLLYALRFFFYRGILRSLSVCRNLT